MEIHTGAAQHWKRTYDSVDEVSWYQTEPAEPGLGFLDALRGGAGAVVAGMSPELQPSSSIRSSVPLSARFQSGRDCVASGGRIHRGHRRRRRGA